MQRAHNLTNLPSPSLSPRLPKNWSDDTDNCVLRYKPCTYQDSFLLIINSTSHPTTTYYCGSEVAAVGGAHLTWSARLCVCLSVFLCPPSLAVSSWPGGGDCCCPPGLLWLRVTCTYNTTSLPCFPSLYFPPHPPLCTVLQYTSSLLQSVSVHSFVLLGSRSYILARPPP